MRMKTFVLTGFIAASLSGPLQAGTWVGGGGELLRDGTNPWFIQNTESVKACIVWDKEAFHLPPDKPDLQHDFVEPALSYWQREFRSTRNVSIWPVTLATQTFVFGPCDADTDLRFQFGSLSPEQRAAFSRLGQSPQHFVSLAVRTDYDSIQLRGKGFIYIAPDTGELRPDEADLLPQPWSLGSGGLLANVLAHELGHVFGIQHTSVDTGNSLNELMNATYPGSLVTQREEDALYYATHPVPAFFSNSDVSPGVTEACGQSWSRRTLDFLEASPDSDCVEWTRHGMTIDFRAGHFGSEVPLVGSIELFRSDYSADSQVPISMWLPPEQKVVDSHGRRTIFVGPVRHLAEYYGFYSAAKSGSQRPVVVSIHSNGAVTFGGILPSGEIFGIPEAAAIK